MKKDYPDPSLDDGVFRLAIQERLLCAWESRKVAARRRREGQGDVEIYPVRKGGIRPLKRDDLPLIVLMHNDRRFVQSFLTHYRGLGVTRFLCLDDQSSDGTREMLEAEEDVDVFCSNVRYRDARRGRLWREALLEMHGAGRWYLNVDSDEYLVYQDCESRPLREFIAALEKRNLERCPAPMIDAYPAGPLDEAHFDGSAGTMPWQVASMLDGDGYQVAKDKRALTAWGGMRERVFHTKVELMKYPLLHWRDGYSLGISIHQPWPYHLNFVPIYGALLHFKFFSDIDAVAREAVRDQQYFDGAKAYAQILDELTEGGGTSLVAKTSIPYRGSLDLVERGFFGPVFS